MDFSYSVLLESVWAAIWVWYKSNEIIGSSSAPSVCCYLLETSHYLLFLKRFPLVCVERREDQETVRAGLWSDAVWRLHCEPPTPWDSPSHTQSPRRRYKTAAELISYPSVRMHLTFSNSARVLTKVKANGKEMYPMHLTPFLILLEQPVCSSMELCRAPRVPPSCDAT